MDDYGLSEMEQGFNLHEYNHALFDNMKGFMDACWEVNLITGTVVMLHDILNEGYMGNQFSYESIFHEFAESKIYHRDRDKWSAHFSMEALRCLREETAVDIHVIGATGIPEMHHVITTPAKDADGMVQRVYISVKNVENDRRILKKMAEEQQIIFSALSSISPIIAYCNLTRNTYIIYTDETMDVDVPMEGSYDAVVRWVSKWLEPEYREEFLQRFRREALADVLHEKRKTVEMEMRQVFPDGAHWILWRAVCMENSTDAGQVVVILVSRVDEQKNRELRLLEAERKEREKKEELSNKLMEVNAEIRHTLSQEEQYRQAIISGALFVYNINVTKKLIEEEFYEIVNGERIPVIEHMGMEAPCDFEEFSQKWAEKNIPEEERESYREIFSSEYLLACHQNGINEIVHEYRTMDMRHAQVALRHTILLTQDNVTGEIIALCSAKDITRQREKEEKALMDLRSAVDAANRANHAKSDFLSRMSHDIRTPLNEIIGMATIAKSQVANPGRVLDCLGKITMSSSQLLTIINEILDMSKIESCQMDMQETEFSMIELLNNLICITRPYVTEKEHELQVTIQDIEHDRVIGDTLRIQQIFVNLMSNAAKYTPPKGKIQLIISEKKARRAHIGRFEFVFEDNGIGMSKEFLGHIFEPFTRETDTRINEIQGTGLGMSITKNIVDMMDGDIQIESELGQGTKVTVTIYLKLPKDAGETSAKEKSMVDAEPEAEEEEEEIHFEGRRILVVEDNELNAEIVLEILGMMGIEAEWAKNGKEAVEMLEGTPPGHFHVVLMDVQMPVMNGNEAARAIRSNPRQDMKEIPIVAVTANAFAEDIQEVLRSGMNEHLAKPLDFQKLTEVLRQWL